MPDAVFCPGILGRGAGFVRPWNGSDWVHFSCLAGVMVFISSVAASSTLWPTAISTRHVSQAAKVLLDCTQNALIGERAFADGEAARVPRQVDVVHSSARADDPERCSYR